MDFRSSDSWLCFTVREYGFNIVERKALEGRALTLSNEVGNLELEYLSVSQKVDLNLAYSLGFKETKKHLQIVKLLAV